MDNKSETILSICIPTYNRERYLDVCFSYLIRQVRTRINEVEIVICDNASVDNTAAIVDKYRKAFPKLVYIRNEKNLGYAGNQVKCIENASGKYIAILCDDDAYMDGLVDRLIELISGKEYAFVALNYYSFFENPEKKIKKEFAPERDVEFKRALDVLNYPSVGHFSGYVFNAKLAKNALKISLEKRPLEYYEKGRGIIFDVAIRALTKSELPSFFLGKRLVAARAPALVDYDSLYHLCLNYYEYNAALFNEGLITKSDLEYRARTVLATLPRAIISNAPFLDNNEIDRITNTLTNYFKGRKRYDSVCHPLLRAVKFAPVKIFFKVIRIFVRAVKGLLRQLKK